MSLINQLLAGIVKAGDFCVIKPDLNELHDVPHIVRNYLSEIETSRVENDTPLFEVPICKQTIILPDGRELIIVYGTKNPLDSKSQRVYRKFDKYLFNTLKMLVEEEFLSIKKMDDKKETFTVSTDSGKSTVYFNFFNEIGGSTLYSLHIRRHSFCFHGEIASLERKLSSIGYQLIVHSDFDVMNNNKVIEHLVTVDAKVDDATKRVELTFSYDRKHSLTGLL